MTGRSQGLVAHLLTHGVLAARLVAGEADVKAERVEPAKTPSAAPAALEPGHSAHGEVFNEGPRQKAYLMHNTGNVHFVVATKSPLAQEFFDQGVGQLHGSPDDRVT